MKHAPAMRCASCGARPAAACGACGAVFFCGAACGRAAGHPGGGCAVACEAMRCAEEATDFGALQGRLVGEAQLEEAARAPPRAARGEPLPPLKPIARLAHENMYVQLCNWPEAYALFDGPDAEDGALAERLHAVLTAHTAVAEALRDLDMRTNDGRASGLKVRVWYLGPEGELGDAGAFALLASLLPGASAPIDVRMVGPQVATEDDGRILLDDAGVRVTAHRGAMGAQFAEELALDAVDVHAAVAVNAGLAAFATWGEYLAWLGMPPTLVTDYTLEAARLAAERAAAAGLSVSEVALNPFRPPLVVRAETSTVPTIPNAFRFFVRHTGR